MVMAMMMMLFMNVDEGDGGKPDQHGDGGDEHDEVAGSKHVGRDREGH